MSSQSESHDLVVPEEDNQAMNGQRTLALVLLMTGCQAIEVPASRLELPKSNPLTTIEVSDRTKSLELPLGETPPVHRITDPARIARFTAFINSRDSGWKTRDDTTPSGAWQAVAKNREETVAVFWGDRNFLAGSLTNEKPDSERLHALNADDREELQDILELDKLQ
jgi:hypothetical protein